MTSTPKGGIVSIATDKIQITREPQLLGETVVLIGGSAGIGLHTVHTHAVSRCCDASSMSRSGSSWRADTLE